MASRINRIFIQNFKSFDTLDLKLRNLNILIGANASGKSNLISFFSFLKNLSNTDNLSNIIGQIEYFRNLNIGNKKNFAFLIDVSIPLTSLWLNDDYYAIYIDNIIYELEINSNGKLTIEKDKLTFKGEIAKIKEGKKAETFPKDKLIIEKNENEIKITLKKNSNILPDKNYFFIKQLLELKKEDSLSQTLLCQPPFSYSPFPWGSYLINSKIWDFDPKSSKFPTLVSIPNLWENGGNLSGVIDRILRNGELKHSFINIVNDILPFINDINTEMLINNQIHFKIQESYIQDFYIPSNLASDGTISILCLIIALFFEENYLSIFEEPERNLHPALISRLSEYLVDVSRNQQIIVTTQNPVLLKYSDLKDVLLIKRDKKGFSNIEKPANKKEVKVFLKNDLGVDDLFVSEML